MFLLRPPFKVPFFVLNGPRYLDVMDYFKKWDGFTGQQAEELFKVFNRRAAQWGYIQSVS